MYLDIHVCVHLISCVQKKKKKKVYTLSHKGKEKAKTHQCYTYRQAILILIDRPFLHFPSEPRHNPPSNKKRQFKRLFPLNLAHIDTQILQKPPKLFFFLPYIHRVPCPQNIITKMIW